MATLVCDIENCGTELKPGTGSHGGLMICPKCRSARYYWKAKGTDAFADRRERLKLWSSRMEYLAPYIAKNIRDAKRRVRSLRKRGEVRASP